MFFLVVLTVLAAGLALFIFKQPDEFRVARSISINTSAANIFPLVSDLQQWQRWSPWAKLDPNMKTRFDGPQEGVGAAMRWHGNPKVGTGRMTITESKPYESVRMRLDFEKPMKAVNTAAFHFRTAGVHTEVSWSMHGTNNFMGKAMALIVNYDKMVGGQFEKGLASIKAIAESSLGAVPQGITMPSRVTVPPEVAKSSVIVKAPEPHPEEAAQSSVIIKSPEPGSEGTVQSSVVVKSSGSGSDSGW